MQFPTCTCTCRELHAPRPASPEIHCYEGLMGKNVSKGLLHVQNFVFHKFFHYNLRVFFFVGNSYNSMCNQSMGKRLKGIKIRGFLLNKKIKTLSKFTGNTNQLTCIT